jgi:hypothetical protein
MEYFVLPYFQPLNAVNKFRFLSFDAFVQAGSAGVVAVAMRLISNSCTDTHWTLNVVFDVANCQSLPAFTVAIFLPSID